MIAIDAAVFIYVINADHEFGPDSLEILKQVESGVFKAVASELVYLEVLASPKLQKGDIAKIRAFLEQSQVRYQPVDTTVLYRAAQLRRDYHLKTPDAIHIATALTHECTHFVTNDIGLLKLMMPNVKMISPHDFNRLAP